MSVQTYQNRKSVYLCRSVEPDNASKGIVGEMEGNIKFFGEIIEILLFPYWRIPDLQELNLPPSFSVPRDAHTGLSLIVV